MSTFNNLNSLKGIKLYNRVKKRKRLDACHVRYDNIYVKYISPSNYTKYYNATKY